MLVGVFYVGIRPRASHEACALSHQPHPSPPIIFVGPEKVVSGESVCYSGSQLCTYKFSLSSEVEVRE